MTATRLDRLATRLEDEDAADLATFPVFGERTETVRRLIDSSDHNGEILSWDTESPIVAHHQYLMRQYDCGQPRLVTYTHAEMVERFERVDGVVGGAV